MIARRLAVLLLVLAVAGCATRGSFPSLAPRAVEQLSFEEPVKVDPPVAPDPALRGQAEALLAQARAGDRVFDTAYADALPRVRAAGGIGSDSWVQAQEAISRVEAARTTSSGALADLDRLVTDRAADAVNDAIWAGVLAAQAAAQALIDGQTRRLDALRRSAGSR